METKNDQDGGDITLQNRAPGEAPQDGRNVIFMPGKGVDGGKDGSIIFRLHDGTEALRFSADGTYVNGEKMDDGRAVYDRILYWLSFGTTGYVES